MIEIKECGGTNIYVMKNILTEKQCAHLVNEFSHIHKMQTIVEAPVWSDQLWDMVEQKISAVEFYDSQMEKQFGIIGFKPAITISKCRAPLRRHVDNQTDGDAFKLFFYLTAHTHECGTNFYEERLAEDADPLTAKKVSIKNELGAGVLFDISLEHESQRIPAGDYKISVGVRPIIEYR